MDELKAYFSEQPEISMAFVFGSYAKGKEIIESDIDIAVYFKPDSRELEWEENKNYEREDEIWGRIERITGLKTDFIVLNRAPSMLAFSVIQTGKPIIIKDYTLYLRFLLTISSAADYFQEFTRDFWEIKQRSQSLSDIDKARLIRIVDFLESELKYYPDFKNLTQAVYESNPATRRNIERWAENIVNSSIDAAKIILASEKRPIPQTYRQIIEDLGLLKDFNPQTAQKLANFSKLRNILAHEYLDIRFNQINRFIQESEQAYQELVEFIKQFVR